MINTSKSILAAACFIIALTSCGEKNSSQETSDKVYIIDNGKKIDVEDTTAQKKNNAPFSSIYMEGIGTIYYTQSDTPSVRATGPQKLLDRMTIKNENGKLIIDFNEEKEKNNKSNLKIYLASPQLEEVKIKGVSNFKAENGWNTENVNLSMEGIGNMQIKNLKCKNLETSLHGVGNMNINVNCENINAHLEGIGNMTLSGKTKSISTSTDGIGKINHGDLEVENDK